MEHMNLKEYEAGLDTPLRQATILLLIRGDEVLLAMKKRGFGVGKWNGVGGKPNPGEDIREAAIREAEEEIMITPINMQQVGELNFYFPSAPLENGWNQQVLVFVTTDWTGEPQETEEMKPSWFKISEIPYGDMWDDDVIWMPKVLAGETVKASFMFGENEKMEEHYISS